MPKSDTWPGGIGLETKTDMDSAGSCDSVASANSGFSDDSLEHLSAEEKACLMFLEETIESLDTEEDSGLSNDELEQLPGPGNLATKLADLSASISQSKLSSSQKHASEEPIKENVDRKPMQKYLVPTPIVVASNSSCSLPNFKPGVPSKKDHSSKPQFSASSKAFSQNQKLFTTQVPLEVNVMFPAPIKHRDFRTTETPRGPLSYDALVHLRRSASAKKTPLCPKIDHTIDKDKHLTVIVEGSNLRNLPSSDRSYSDAGMSKAAPPVVAPKPQKIPSHIPMKTQTQVSVGTDSHPYNVKHAKDPQVVRLEALQKLGLLKDQQPQNESSSSLDPTPNRFKRGPSNLNPTRSPSFSYSQVPIEPKNRPLQSSASFHNHFRCDPQPSSASHPAQRECLKVADVGCSSSQDKHRHAQNNPEQQRIKESKSVETMTAAQSATHKLSNSVKYTVMVVPGMGADRREALRKLGLLKE